MLAARVEGTKSALSSGAALRPAAQTALAVPADVWEIEWQQRRSELVASGRHDPSLRLSSLLRAAATSDCVDGMEMPIADVDSCDYVADLLGIRLDELARLLLQLHAAGIVAPLPDGRLRITDLAALEQWPAIPEPIRSAAWCDASSEDASGSASRQGLRCYGRSLSARDAFNLYTKHRSPLSP